MATIAQIKEQLNIPQFNLNKATKDGQPTAWYRHWDNDNRVAVSIHEDTVKQLQSNPDLNTLGMQTEKRNGKQGEYTAIRLVAYKPAEVVL